MSHALEADGIRLWSTLERSAEIGRIDGGGLRRLTLSSEDKEMRGQFAQWVEAECCTLTIDRLGNMFARRSGSDDSLAPVVVGSHLDTQIYGGCYDGILGVLSGLEIVRRLNELDVTTKRPIEIVNWTNEEGARFNPPMMGASGFAGIYPIDDIFNALDQDGIRFEDALKGIGYAGAAPLGRRQFDSYFELHIEQGPQLYERNIDIGVVNGSYKAHGCHIRVLGENAHVGPTPMEKRQNALVGAAYIAAAVNDIGWKYAHEDAKTTVSRIECHPNTFGIIPHEVTITVDCRHAQRETADRMLDEIRDAMAAASEKARVSAEITQQWFFGDASFSDDCISLLRDMARAMDLNFTEIPSQAGHDAYAVAQVAPTAMIFTPCIDGITHNVKERIELDKTLPGVNLLLNAVVARANR
jgi:N-carbamoyl-L-amino-acid hydrolase